VAALVQTPFLHYLHAAQLVSLSQSDNPVRSLDHTLMLIFMEQVNSPRGWFLSWQPLSLRLLQRLILSKHPRKGRSVAFLLPVKDAGLAMPVVISMMLPHLTKPVHRQTTLSTKPMAHPREKTLCRM
jgi:hypothetical protein